LIVRQWRCLTIDVNARSKDEIGTPWCVTIDFETIEKDGTFTLRDRDTLQQVRVSEAELLAMLDEKTE
jgi:glycyl-tRNA synthetase